MRINVLLLAAILFVMLALSNCARNVGDSHFASSGGFPSGDKVENTSKVIDRYLRSNPEMIVDLSRVSGEYCINTWNVGGAHMTHYAVNPSSTNEDVVDFVKAQSFVDAGIDVTTLPLLPDTLGRMKDGQWYYLPIGGMDPHHGRRTPVALLVRATNIR